MEGCLAEFLDGPQVGDDSPCLAEKILSGVSEVHALLAILSGRVRIAFSWGRHREKLALYSRSSNNHICLSSLMTLILLNLY
jgi:hypothetical protein